MKYSKGIIGIVLLVLLIEACGSGVGTSGTGKPQDPNLADSPEARSEICEKNWALLLSKQTMGASEN